MPKVFQFAKVLIPKLITWSLVSIAAFGAYFLYMQWTEQPWTRDGQIRADIVKITPQVSGNLVKVAVRDNQFVHKGDLLLEIDQSSYQLAVNKARVAVDQAKEEVASLEASVRVSAANYEEAKVSVTTASRQISSAEASVQSAKASVDQMKAGVTSAQQFIKQRKAELSNAHSEAARAKRLVEKKAGSVEDAESTAATAIAKEAQLASAKAGLIQAQASQTQSEAALNEAHVNLLLAKDGLSESKAAETSAKASLDQAKANLGMSGDENVRVRTAMVSLAQAELDLSRTKILAPCNGYISNLSVDEGTYAVVGQPLIVIVDSDTFRVHAYFQETKLRHIEDADSAVITLMSHPDRPLKGFVENIGNAVNPPNIANTEGQPGEVPQIQPTFDWVRLPQRVPVRIRLSEVPDDIQLISGTTASVAVLLPDKE
ncbi:Multidrug resistance protein MdtN [Symmachiella dynata]|uniref:HlyD family secretion protein n=1 Tax=Symmachiella dynata TaxID=2527995 RepID=UPI0011896E02|nr:HlyD family secretion protein [Symmachiella dynata]QDT48959.1 Multidrug resistance protein MdtN [Symmachiella dynata]